MNLYTALRPLLFRLDAETAHNLTFRLLEQDLLQAGVPAYTSPPALARTTGGLRFPNPLGLAAGLDKDARLLPVWKRLGFGFAEVGTVTPRPQAGNPRPRLFRLPRDRALINRMGFNNAGVEAVARRLAHRPADFVVGVNLGKNRDTPNERAVEDYRMGLERLFPLADYFVVNVSSPNTPGLRALQAAEALAGILEPLQAFNQRQAQPRPLWLKIAPDLSEVEFEGVVRVVQELELTGVVATNTTLNRSGLLTPPAQLDVIGAGGLSGQPLRNRSTEWVRHLANAGLNVIGAGGIFTAADAREKLEAGAVLLQCYTGFIYRGPALVRDVLEGLAREPANPGMTSGGIRIST